MGKKQCSNWVILVILALLVHSLYAAEKKDTNKIQTYAVFQNWNRYSFSDTEYEAEFRRLRAGLKGEPLSFLSYNVMFQYDRLGSRISSTSGFAPTFVNISFYPFKNKAVFCVNTGYIWAGITREFLTSPLTMAPLDKTPGITFLRNFLTAKSNGIVPGTSINGSIQFPALDIYYRSGIFFPEKFNTITSYSGPLQTAHLTFSFFDREREENNSFTMKGVHFGRRNMLSVGMGASYAGSTKNWINSEDTISFSRQYAYGVDGKAEIQNIEITGEAFWLESGLSNSYFKGLEWSFQLSYKIFITAERLFQPFLQLSGYRGKGLDYTVFRNNGSYFISGIVFWYTSSNALSINYTWYKETINEIDDQALKLVLQVRF